MVGTSGAWEERFTVVTASGLSLPAFTCWITFGRLSNRILTCPPIGSVTAGALPLYGVCRMSMPGTILKYSAVTWLGVPFPADAYASLPRGAFASDIDSFAAVVRTEG